MTRLLQTFLAAICLISSSSFAQARIGQGEIASLYDRMCSTCHGKNMQGGMAPTMLDDTWTVGNSDEALAKAIAQGVPGTAMQGYSATLSSEQIRGLVILIREQRYLDSPPPAPTVALGDTIETTKHNFKVEEFGRGEGDLWGLDFMPNGDLLVTQKDGVLWRFSEGKRFEIKGLPKVADRRQGGLLDVNVLDTDKKSPWVYLTFSDPGKGGAGTSVVRGRIKDNRWTDNAFVYRLPEAKRDNPGRHFGSRIVFQDGYLFFSIGDSGRQDEAQDLSSHNGKIHRLTLDGKTPKDNPFVGKKNALATIWTYGNRNAQGLDIHPETGELWGAEHGPRGGDEVNRLQRGNNYGWPLVTHGMNYNGTPMTDRTSAPGMIDPAHHWTPSIAVCGIAFYDGALFPNWNNSLFVASLAAEQLHRLEIKNGKVVKDEVILKGLGRLRDVATGPDGKVYILANGSKNRVLAISPVKKTVTQTSAL